MSRICHGIIRQRKTLSRMEDTIWLLLPVGRSVLPIGFAKQGVTCKDHSFLRHIDSTQSLWYGPESRSPSTWKPMSSSSIPILKEHVCMEAGLLSSHPPARFSPESDSIASSVSEA